MRQLAAAAVLLILAGCSGPVDPNQAIVLQYLKATHGNDPVTAVKWYKSAESDDELKVEAEKAREQINADIASMIKSASRLERMIGEAEDRENVKESPELTALKIRAKKMKSDTEAMAEDSDRMFDARRVPFTATRLVYRVPNARGENSLNDHVFIVRDGKITDAFDLSVDQSVYAAFARRVFKD